MPTAQRRGVELDDKVPDDSGPWTALTAGGR